jgi:hypothetical protein
MKNLRSLIARSIITLGVMGVCLAVSSAEARAEFIDFQVVESEVPGVPDDADIITADKLTGSYTELLTLGAGNTFTADAFATFRGYDLDGDPVTAFLADVPVDETYTIFAEMTASGNYVDNPDCDPGAPVTPCRIFTATSGNAELWVDPDGDPSTLDNILLLTSSNMLPGSGGQLISSTDPVTGNFNFVFGTNVLSSPFGEAYWPTLANVVFTSTVNGDFDEVTGDNPQTISGDVSAQFEVIPEPASLTLFGLALLGGGVAARRRRTTV